MKRIFLWLLVAIVVVGVGVYLAVTSLGPKPEPPARETVEESEPPQVTTRTDQVEPVEAEERQVAPPEETAQEEGEPVAETGVAGVVTLVETEQPVAKAIVFCPTEENPDRKKAEADDDGRYKFEGLSKGTHTFVAVAPGFATPTPARVEVQSGEVARLDLVLEPCAAIRGEVIDRASGLPVVGAKVIATLRTRDSYTGGSPFESFDPDLPLHTLTDEEGAFSIPLRVAAMTRLLVHAEDYEEAHVDLEDVESGTRLHIELSRGCMIAGEVLSPQGEPLAGATVIFGFVPKSPALRVKWSWGIMPESPPGWEREETDEEGRFCFGGLLPGTYYLSGWHDKYARAWSEPIKIEAEQAVEDVTIQLGLGGYITGVVTDENGLPFKGADLHLEKVGGDGVPEPFEGRELEQELADWFKVQSGEDGTYSSPLLPPGEYTVSIRAENRVPVEKQGVIVEAGMTVADINFVLSEGVTIEGKVVDADGTPIVGASVAATVGPWPLLLVSEARTDEQGCFVLRGLMAGEREISASAEGFTGFYGLLEAPATGVEIVLRHGCTISGRVIDKRTRQPVEDFTVRLEIAPNVSPTCQGGKDEAGHFKWTGVLPGTYSVTVWSEFYAPATVKDIEVKKGDASKELLVELVEGATVLFHVTAAPEGEPVERATIVRQSGSLFADYSSEDEGEPFTEADGTCSIKHLAPGRYTYAVRHKSFAEKTVVVTLGDNEQQKKVEVVLDAGLTLRGRVVTKVEHDPIPRAYVRLRTAGQRTWYYYYDDMKGPSQETDETGAFTFECVVPGRYLLSVTHPDFAPLQQDRDFRQGDSEALLVELDSGGRIVGTVTTTDGLPVAQAKVFIRSSGSSYELGGGLLGISEEETETNDQGHYEVPFLPPGVYKVTASPPSATEAETQGQTSERKFAAVHVGEDTQADFVFAGGAAIFGTITQDGQPRAGIGIHISPRRSSFAGETGIMGRAESDKHGEYRIDGLKPGRYDLEIWGHEAGGSPTLARRVFEIGTEDVQLDFDLSSNIVAGVVLDEAGNPIRGARFTLLPVLKPGEEDRITAIHSAFDTRYGPAPTDEKGAFALYDVSPKSCRLCVSKMGYAFQIVPLDRPGTDLTDLVVRLQKESVVTGRVETPGSALPRHIMVAVFDEKNGSLYAEAAGVDLRTGEVRIEGLSSGRFTITARAMGYAPLCKEVHIEPKTETKLDLDFKKGQTLEVAAVDKRGAPVPGAEVILDSGDDPLMTGMTARLTMWWRCSETDFLGATNERGSTTLRHVADGDYTVRVRCDGYEDASAKVRIAGRDEVVNITLKPGNVRGE